MLAALIYELLLLYVIISETHTHLQARVTPNPGYKARYCGNISIALALHSAIHKKSTTCHG